MLVHVSWSCACSTVWLAFEHGYQDVHDYEQVDEREGPRGSWAGAFAGNPAGTARM